MKKKGWWDHAVYLSGLTRYAQWWGALIIRCSLRQGTRALWRTP